MSAIVGSSKKLQTNSSEKGFFSNLGNTEPHYLGRRVELIPRFERPWTFNIFGYLVRMSHNIDPTIDESNLTTRFFSQFTVLPQANSSDNGNLKNKMICLGVSLGTLLLVILIIGVIAL